MSNRELPWSVAAPPAAGSGRQIAAAVLQLASGLLAALARHLVAARPRPARAEALPVLEFYAEAGAPEGALYVNGQLVGRLPGVTRL